jgi:hypothetical protein
MEQTGQGSDPQAATREGDLRCAHCGTPILDERTIEIRGDQSFCCANCAATHS